jgi:hypothetical protein
VCNKESYTLIPTDTRKVSIRYNEDFIVSFTLSSESKGVTLIGSRDRSKVEIVELADNEVIIGVLA